jgi:hypothetical protein
MYPDKLDNTCEENRVIPHYDLSIPRGVTVTLFAHNLLDDEQLGQALPYMAERSKKQGFHDTWLETVYSSCLDQGGRQMLSSLSNYD